MTPPIQYSMKLIKFRNLSIYLVRLVLSTLL